MASKSYMSGSLVRSTATFKDINGDLASPDTVTCQFQAGSGDVQTGDVTTDSTGIFHCDIDTTGQLTAVAYVIQWTGTGTVQAIASDTFNVTPAPIVSS